eukprot:g5809.t1
MTELNAVRQVVRGQLRGKETQLRALQEAELNAGRACSMARDELTRAKAEWAAEREKLLREVDALNQSAHAMQRELDQWRGGAERLRVHEREMEIRARRLREDIEQTF